MFKTKILLSGLFLAILTAGNAYSRNTDIVPSLLITPASNNSSEYQVARSKFLPEFTDSETGWGGNKIGSGYNRKDCSAFPLRSCPSGGKCTKCPVGAGYRLDSCKSGYNRSGNSCVVSSCSALNSTYKSSIPVNQVCTKVTAGNMTCYKDCRSISCSGYTLNCDTFNVANSASKEVCPDCNKDNVTCSPKLCKVGSCQSGYKIADNGTTCVALSDVCPDGYYKSCETGTQGTPKYTEKGTACYQCKPKSVENIKVTINFAKSCPSGLTFKMAPQGASTVTCSSSQCYEYDLSGKPYAPDGQHSNETESIVNVGTQINLSSIPSAVSGIKSVSKNQTYPVSGTTYSFSANNRATVIAGVGQDTSTGLGAYDFWTLQCKSAAELCLAEGYKLRADWPKPTASNNTVIPSTMLANFMKNVFNPKHALARNFGDLTTPMPDPDIDPVVPGRPADDDQLEADLCSYIFQVSATCPYDSEYVKGEWIRKCDCTLIGCLRCTDPGLETERCTMCDSGYSLLSGRCNKISTNTCKVSGCKTCVSGSTTKCSVCESGYELTSTGLCQAAYNPGTGNGCTGVKLTCINNTYCCDSSTGITSCSQINSSSSSLSTAAKCFMMTTNQKTCDGKSITCDGASYCCSDSMSTCSNKRNCTLL